MKGDPNNPVWSTARAEADIVFCTFSILETIAKERQAMALVWPEEGDFNEHDDFVFNEAHLPKNLGHPYEPLLCDVQTAQMLVVCRNSLSDTLIEKPTHPFYGKTRKEAFDARLAESRAYFGAFIEIGWGAVSFKAE